MQWFTVVLLALVSNLDNFGIGIGLGLQRVRLPWTSNALIAAVAALATALAVYGGHALAIVLPSHWANVLGGCMISLIGGWVSWTGRKNSQWEAAHRSAPRTAADRRPSSTSLFDILRAPASADVDQSGKISWHEALALGIAMGLNCLAGGFAAGMTGLPGFWAVVLTALFSYVLTGLGVSLGRYAGQLWFGRYSHLVSGLLLVALGFYECLL
ncbi:MAG: manganese efflux pump [Alicyclobacillaceae bacterium]|nr:manganese efflux pump [Alicyclobacillaceae bacterium]